MVIIVIIINMLIVSFLFSNLHVFKTSVTFKKLEVKVLPKWGGNYLVLRWQYYIIVFYILYCI